MMEGHMAKVYRLPIGDNGEGSQWENIEGALVLPSQERKLIQTDMCELLNLNGVLTGPEDVIIGRRAIQLDSPETALGVQVISYVAAHKDYSDVMAGVHPTRATVLYFSSETMRAEEVDVKSAKLMHLTDMLLKFAQSPFRILKDR